MLENFCNYSSKCTDFVRFSFNLVSAWYSPSHLACKNYEDKELRKFGLLGRQWFMVRMKMGEKQRLKRKFEGKIPHTRKIGRKSSVLSQTPALPRSSCRIELVTSALRHFDFLWCDLQRHYCIHRLHLSLFRQDSCSSSLLLCLIVFLWCQCFVFGGYLLPNTRKNMGLWPLPSSIPIM